MSIPAFAWARERGRELKLSAPERWLLVVLADRANGKLFCWPSIGQLMDDTGLARQTILTVVHTLARIGLIRIEKRGRGHEYHVLRPADRSKSDTDQQSKSRPQEASASVQNKTDDRSKSGPTNGLDRSKNRSRSVQIRYSNRSKSDTLTLKETKKEPLRAREAPPVRDATPQPPEGAGVASTSAAANGAAPPPQSTSNTPMPTTPVGSAERSNELRYGPPHDPFGDGAPANSATPETDVVTDDDRPKTEADRAAMADRIAELLHDAFSHSKQHQPAAIPPTDRPRYLTGEALRTQRLAAGIHAHAA